jgi:hypothetical protein
MENTSALGNTLTETAAQRLLAAARWAKIYGLLLCVFSGFGLVMMLISLTALASFSSFVGDGKMGFIYLIFFAYMAVLGFMLYLNIQLVYFGGDIKSGLYSGDDSYLENGFARLGRYFKIISILMISLVAISIFFGLLMAIIGGSSALMAPDTPEYPKTSF